MKEYKLSCGVTLNYSCFDEKHDCYSSDIEWRGFGYSEVPTTFTPDEDDPDSYDCSVELFERIYARRELWFMKAYHQLKLKLIDDIESSGENYEDYVTEYRDGSRVCGPQVPSLYATTYAFFDELLCEIALCGVILGNEGEVIFAFYDASRECYYEVQGTENQGFTSVEQIDGDME
ncbi:MAG: hypothetical protein IKN80_05415 [Clostridiales bacterium]|nr:hypothetical protein [Clostridiales bacterium]